MEENGIEDPVSVLVVFRVKYVQYVLEREPIRSLFLLFHKKSFVKNLMRLVYVLEYDNMKANIKII